ncbi:hypothetical protein HX004_15465 [Myroides sp. 1354]|uniref:hypothetical protein n=1 Tax=unclassified Myroides TaxID=2642485 RepID=UPI0025786B22|nr:MULTISPECIES: hypothetical protein [unclassified Myroides]MDM1046221.1 hypothetical protein [Myroides sp. R163-1]MDM1057157.1 hypothetical protein [Myroides sp. 1354]MDM1070352.1 hypothetical protein [Myroides sp. 1372]
MNTIANYFKRWTPMRYIRLGLALLLLFQTIDSRVWVLGIPAAYLFIQAVFNFGCKNDSCVR